MEKLIEFLKTCGSSNASNVYHLIGNQLNPAVPFLETIEPFNNSKISVISKIKALGQPRMVFTGNGFTIEGVRYEPELATLKLSKEVHFTESVELYSISANQVKVDDNIGYDVVVRCTPASINWKASMPVIVSDLAKQIDENT